jgi:hypothetical protein
VDVYTEGKTFNECFEQNKEYERAFVAQQAQEQAEQNARRASL